MKKQVSTSSLSKPKSKPKKHSNISFELERVLGLTVSSNNQLCIHPTESLVAYPAAATLIIYNYKKNKQQLFLTAANQFLDKERQPSKWDIKKNHSLNFGGVKAISCLSFSNDGEYLAVGEAGHQPRILVWDYKNSKLLADLTGHKFALKAIKFSPTNSSYLVSVGVQHDGNIFVWNWKNGQKLAASKFSVMINTLSFDPTGSFFVTVGFRHVKFWSFDIKTYNLNMSNALKQQTQQQPNTSNQKPLLISQIEGKYGVMGDHKNNNFVDVSINTSSNGICWTYTISESGLLVAFNEERIMDKWLDLRVKRGNCISVSEKYIVCGGSDGIIRIFEPDTLKFISNIPKPTSLIIDISGSGDSSINDANPDTVSVRVDTLNQKVVGIYNDHSFIIWDITDCKKILKYRSFLHHSDCVWGVEMNPDSENESSLINQHPDFNKYSCLPANTFITYSSDGTVRFWNLETHSSPNAVSVNNDDIYNRNIYSKELLKILYLNPTALEMNKLKTDATDDVNAKLKYEKNCGIRALCVSGDGKWLSSGDRAGNIRVHELSTFKEMFCIEAHDAEVLSIDFSLKSADESTNAPNLMATASRDRLIHIFDINNGFKLLQTLDDHSSSITSVKFCENGKKLLSCAADKSIIFRILQESEIYDSHEYVTFHNESGRSTVYDMDIDATQKFVSTVSQDKRLNIYSTATGKPVRSYKHDQSEEQGMQDNGGGGFLKVSMDPSGLFAATASSDKYIRVFDFYSGACITRMAGHSELITSIKFSLDGSRLITTGGDSCVFIWTVPINVTKQIRNRLKQLASERVDGPVISVNQSPSNLLPNYKREFSNTSQIQYNNASDEDEVDLNSKIEKRDPTALSTTSSVSPTNAFYDEIGKQAALKRKTSVSSTHGFVFRYSETGLPSWARAGYDPNKSLSLESKTKPEKAIPSLWAERIGTEGVELFSELSDNDKPVVKLNDVSRKYSLHDLSPDYPTAERDDANTESPSVLEDSTENTLHNEGKLEKDSNSTAEVIELAPTEKEDLEEDVQSEKFFLADNLNETASSNYLIRKEENLFYGDDSLSNSQQELTKDETVLISKNGDSSSKELQPEANANDLEIDFFDEREFEGKNLDEYLGDQVALIPNVEIRKSFTAQHLVGKETTIKNLAMATSPIKEEENEADFSANKTLPNSDTKNDDSSSTTIVKVVEEQKKDKVDENLVMKTVNNLSDSSEAKVATNDTQPEVQVTGTSENNEQQTSADGDQEQAKEKFSKEESFVSGCSSPVNFNDTSVDFSQVSDIEEKKTYEDDYESEESSNDLLKSLERFESSTKTETQNILRLLKISENLQDENNKTSKEEKKNNFSIEEVEKIHKVFKEVHNSTIFAIESIEKLYPIKEDNLLKSKKEKKTDILEMVDSGILKSILETYSDLLINLVKEKSSITS
ncbi:hypothetical protein HDU92_006708 [Lobulomyces angularis]|nr:hypothetical protein HDU92_006708 [Lobulomyces angularis]